MNPIGALQWETLRDDESRDDKKIVIGEGKVKFSTGFHTQIRITFFHDKRRDTDLHAPFKSVR